MHGSNELQGSPRGRRGPRSGAGWVLGALALVALQLAGCKNDSTGPKVGPPAQVSIQAGNGQTAVAGAALSVGPVVTVRDASGNPVSGVIVTFQITAGGGNVTYPSVATEMDGSAAAGVWTLGDKVGTNELTASVQGLDPVVFTATGTAGPAAILSKAAGDQQSTNAGTAVTVSPAVRVTDAHDNPVPGITVTFTVDSGGGSVVGATVATDANGLAAVGQWTLGSTPGDNALQATASGLTPVTFSAMGLDPCSNPGTLSADTTVNGTFTTTDCFANGVYWGLFNIDVTAQSSIQFTLTSDQFDPYLDMLSGIGDPYDGVGSGTAGGTPATFHMLLAPGSYLLRATSTASNNLGSYTLSAMNVSSDIANCVEVMATPGVTTDQSIDDTDCDGGSGSRFDEVTVYMPKDSTFTILASSTQINTTLRIRDQSGKELDFNDDIASGNTNSKIVFLVPVSAPYRIEVGTHDPAERGAYTLSIQD